MERLPTMYERIVVGTDGSDRALDAVRAAGRLAGLCGLSEVHVVTACRTYTSSELERIRSGLPEEFRDVVNPHVDAEGCLTAAESTLGPTVSMVPHDRSGDPADAILSVAEAEGADLIVVGARGLGAVSRFLRGSVSTKVAHHSRCDVLVVEHDT
jgi:nucleotide-binding universal stress UspA family protein